MKDKIHIDGTDYDNVASFGDFIGFVILIGIGCFSILFLIGLLFIFL